ncbi:hypothetical protein BDY21DRAFT_163485 [Lineolata rhizophorae]|uniref:Uncharacterized protein n=1 Tax=Lineolata rhizophorae TaxID=578093 RepID=A0A6A6P9B4_9PEZI|nr:hypothetical protein BDY21DRAFT_163485 [Lineolata rhizophorae]
MGAGAPGTRLGGAHHVRGRGRDLYFRTAAPNLNSDTPAPIDRDRKQQLRVRLAFSPTTFGTLPHARLATPLFLAGVARLHLYVCNSSLLHFFPFPSYRAPYSIARDLLIPGPEPPTRFVCPVELRDAPNRARPRLLGAPATSQPSFPHQAAH